jgi:hypothetical protein
MVKYALHVRWHNEETREHLVDMMRTNIKYLLDRKSLFVTRTSGPAARGRRSPVKKVDVRPFLQSIQLDERQVEIRGSEECSAFRILVECKIGPAGSIRVDEILGMLELGQDKLAAPVRRTNVQWEQHES